MRGLVTPELAARCLLIRRPREGHVTRFVSDQAQGSTVLFGRTGKVTAEQLSLNMVGSSTRGVNANWALISLTELRNRSSWFLLLLCLGGGVDFVGGLISGS